MKLRIHVDGRAYDVDVDVLREEAVDLPEPAPTETIPAPVLRPRPPQRLPEDSVCRSPIAGRVAAVVAHPGQEVRRHEGVVLIEAMKMEVPIGPAVEGIVQAIYVGPGDPVKTGQPLFELA